MDTKVTKVNEVTIGPDDVVLSTPPENYNLPVVQGGVDAAIEHVETQSKADRERRLAIAFFERKLTWGQYAGLSDAAKKQYRKQALPGQRRWPESPTERATRMRQVEQEKRRKKAARQARRGNR